MKIRAKFSGKSYPIENIDETTTIEQLRVVIAATLNIQHFSLSLNNRDFFDDENNRSTSLKDQGIVGGDTIFVIIREASDVTMQPSAPTKSNSPSTKPKPPNVSQRAEASTSGDPNRGSSSQQIQRPVSIVGEMLAEMNPSSPMESIVICAHGLLVDRGFRTTNATDGNDRSLPTNWRQGLQNSGVLLTTYRHPRSDIPLRVTSLFEDHGEKSFATLRGTFVCGSEPETRNVDVPLREYFLSKKTNALKDEDEVSKLCERLEQWVNGLRNRIVGYDSPIMNLPTFEVDVRMRMVRRMPLTTFRTLTSTCKEMRKLWDDDSIWKMMLKRDFGDETVQQTSVYQNDHQYRDEYRRRFTERKEARQRRAMMFHQPNPNPPPGVVDPNSNYHPEYPNPEMIPGTIGGRSDLNPLGPFPAPPRPWNPYNPYGGVPDNRPFFPGGPRPPGPRVDPSIYDPDAGLFGPRFGPRGGGRGGHNPFGPGGPRFPGGGGFI